MFRLSPFLKTFSSLRLQKTPLAKLPTLRHACQWSFSTPNLHLRSLSQKLSFYYSASQTLPREASENEFKNLLSKYNLESKQGELSRTEILNLLTSLAQMTNPAAYSGFTLRYYLEAAKLAEEVGLNDVTEAGGLYVWIVTLYLNGENVENIESYVDKGIQVYSNAVKNNEPGAKSGLVHLELAKGIIHSRKGSLDKALDIFKGILKQEKEIPEEDLVMLLPQIYENLGTISENKGDLVEAAKYLERALETAANTLGEDSEEIITLLKRIVDVEIKRHNYQQALDYANRSLNLSRKHYGENDDKTKAYEKTVAEIEAKLKVCYRSLESDYAFLIL